MSRHEAVRQCWRKWVAVRDVPCAGHPWRFSKHQLEYHYTHGGPPNRTWIIHYVCQWILVRQVQAQICSIVKEY